MLPVVAVGVPKVPPAPLSLNVTLTPCTGLPELEAKTVRAVGRVVFTIPL